MENIIKEGNKFYDKLKDWYGNHLNIKKLEILHTHEIFVDGKKELVTVIFMMEINEQIEVARIFSLGDQIAISIDCQADPNTLQGARKLIQYGGNFQRFEIE